MSVDVTGQDVIEAHKKRLKDAMTKGFAVSQERAPQDRGQLQQSGFPPEERESGRFVYGYTAPYADSMEFGTDPGHTPPPGPILEWAQRIGRSEGFGWWVATEKIPEEGVDAHPYLRPSAEAVQDYLKTHDLEF